MCLSGCECPAVSTSRGGGLDGHCLDVLSQLSILCPRPAHPPRSPAEGGDFNLPHLPSSLDLFDDLPLGIPLLCRTSLSPGPLLWVPDLRQRWSPNTYLSRSRKPPERRWYSLHKPGGSSNRNGLPDGSRGRKLKFKVPAGWFLLKTVRGNPSPASPAASGALLARSGLPWLVGESPLALPPPTAFSQCAAPCVPMSPLHEDGGHFGVGPTSPASP